MYYIQNKGLTNKEIHDIIRYQMKEGNPMFYVVDQWNQYIREFETREEAEAFCEKWNSKFRFSEWTAPKAHVVEGEE
jgi:hypothetical protein